MQASFPENPGVSAEVVQIASPRPERVPFLLTTREHALISDALRCHLDSPEVLDTRTPEGLAKLELEVEDLQQRLFDCFCAFCGLDAGDVRAQAARMHPGFAGSSWGALWRVVGALMERQSAGSL